MRSDPVCFFPLEGFIRVNSIRNRNPGIQGGYDPDLDPVPTLEEKAVSDPSNTLNIVEKKSIYIWVLITELKLFALLTI